MKSYIKAAAAALLFLFVGAAAFFFITKDICDDNDREYLTELNDIAKTAEEQNDLDFLDDKRYSYDFVILDPTDNVLYTSTDNADELVLSVEAAVKKHYPYQYITDNGHIKGCVILLYDGMNGYRASRLRLMTGICVCGLFTLIGVIILGIYLLRNVILPFRRMQSFAGRVAEGKLDEPLEMDRDNLFGAFSESFDIMREELIDAKQRETELQKKERELVASLSHDLKTPVTGIKLAAELLQMRLSVKAENSDDEIVLNKDETRNMSESIEGILQKTEQINVLVTDLFTSALDDLGEFKVNCRDEQSSVLPDIVRSYDDKDLTVTSEVPAVIINIDKKRMSQVIGNIISNSYKYADTAIDISFTLSDGFLEMRIKDHGSGVPADELDLITNKFYRGKAWADSGKDGNGLGLYIAKTLMKKMNGDLITENDNGLAVTLVIPLS
ncbi:MAG: HAMP domain-containing histidine kinase [Oscillospiraceae bacterium]|nr:HAMP domain-containing histidine kinase [Oscillospiraceae bacterium]